MRVLIACEFSGIVREAFKAKGHYTLSCDLLPTEISGNHYQGDVRDLLMPGQWDLMIGHPSCTYLAVSGARWFKDKGRKEKQKEALEFVRILLNAPIEKICIENPVSIISTKIKKPSQYVQPYEYGHGETKKTCLWLKNLPLLKPTNIVEGREARVHKMPPSKDRGKNSRGLMLELQRQWQNNGGKYN